jgi:hypothetical protein
MNSYATVDAITSSGVLNITGATTDATLRALLEAVSRQVDRYCNRHFYDQYQVRKFSPDHPTLLLTPDLVEISTVKGDDDRDRTFETTWAATDFIEMPPNADPTTAGNQDSRPYTSLEVDVDAGAIGAFPIGRNLLEIAGWWGWWRHLKRATETANAVADTTTTSVVVSSRASVEAGHTILIDTEQMYAESYSSSTLTVRRGVNGTTAATHSGGAAIDIYEYPAPVEQAVIIMAARLWKRADSAFASVVGFPDGSMQVFKRLDSDVQELLAPFRKMPLGVGV